MMRNRATIVVGLLGLLAIGPVGVGLGQTGAPAPQATIDRLLEACGAADRRGVRDCLTDDAEINGLSLEQALQSMSAIRRDYRLDEAPVVLHADERRRTFLVSYTVAPQSVAGAAMVDLSLTDQNQWRIQRLARVPRTAAVLAGAGRPALVAVNPIRNLFLGVRHVQHVRFFPAEAVPRIAQAQWSAALQTKDHSYPIDILGPSSIEPGGEAELRLSPPAELAGRADLCDQQEATLVIRCGDAGLSSPVILSWPVFTYDNARHHAVHASLVDFKRLGLNRRSDGLSEVRVRFRVLDLAHTYYACMRFTGGYAGFQYHPPRAGQAEAFAYWFSVWNNPDAGRDKRNRLSDVGGAEDGWVAAEVPERARGDENYAGIRNMKIGWRPGVEYTCILNVAEDRIDDETWTKFTLTCREHAAAAGAEADHIVRTVPFGSILRYGELRITYCHAFMEALGQTFNYQRRQMEIVAVEYRLAGSDQMRAVDLTTVAADADDASGEPDRYPRGAWLAQGRLRFSSGGQTPLHPGELLLDY